MAESSSEFTERTAETMPAALGAEYTPTEEERKVFKQCDEESFWYRSVPFSASAMALTHMLVTKGKLTSSPRFGSLPKVLFAGMCGYFAGKLSYMKTCRQKFYNLENSPIAEALRQRHRHHHRPPQFAGPQPELSEDEKPQFEVFQSESVSDSPPDLSYSDTTHSAPHRDLHTRALREEEEEGEEVKKKPILYEELRNKNRENYDITRNQKIDRDTPKKDVKKNKYGDTWDE
ncbi:OCIA domain-containing protein 1-like [Ictalurus furcatus]|uniref:OCIA domain-containing protein 1-like n=1 Tax=Ictalurus furcatus TaxID=66913 RepID=UPI00234FEFED|nr:OCIA domain-containing protein 1-like [Ictalurus furcatus]